VYVHICIFICVRSFVCLGAHKYTPSMLSFDTGDVGRADTCVYTYTHMCMYICIYVFVHKRIHHQCHPFIFDVGEAKRAATRIYAHVYMHMYTYKHISCIYMYIRSSIYTLNVILSHRRSKVRCHMNIRICTYTF